VGVRIIELVALTLVSAVICVVALLNDYVLATGVFAALTATIGMVAVALTRRI
jgi:hypothetical protein